MTLLELSEQYKDSADLIAGRLRQLREQERRTADEEVQQQLHRRILDLNPLLRQCRDTQRLLANYYGRRNSE